MSDWVLNTFLEPAAVSFVGNDINFTSISFYEWYFKVVYKLKVEIQVFTLTKQKSEKHQI